jgi:hypothetical protein
LIKYKWLITAAVLPLLFTVLGGCSAKSTNQDISGAPLPAQSGAANPDQPGTPPGAPPGSQPDTVEEIQAAISQRVKNTTNWLDSLFSGEESGVVEGANHPHLDAHRRYFFWQRLQQNPSEESGGNFRGAAKLDWFERKAGLFYSFEASLFQTLDSSNVLQYQISAHYETDPQNRLEVAYARLKYRRQMWRDWIFMELAPQAAWRRENDYEPSYGIFLRF